MKRGIDMKRKIVGATIALSFVLGIAGCDSQVEETVTVATEGTTVTEVSETTTIETSADTTPTSEITDATTVDDESNPYRAFIEDYKASMIAPDSAWYYGPGVDDETEQVPDGVVGLPRQGLSAELDYILFDIDGDGVEELIIGGVYMDTVEVIGVVTMIGDEYKIVFAGWSRRYVEYLGEGYFYAAGSGGATNHLAGIYKYDGESKCVNLICLLESEDEMSDDAKYYFYEGAGGENMTDVIYTGQDAVNAFDRELEAVQGLNNELLDAEWMTETFKSDN